MARIDEGLARPCARHDGGTLDRSERRLLHPADRIADLGLGAGDRRAVTAAAGRQRAHGRGPAIIAARDPHDSGDRRELRVARDAPGTRGAARDAERRRGDPVGGRQPLSWRPGDLSLQRNVQSRSRGARRRHGGSVCHSHAGLRSRGLGDSPFRVLRRYSEIRVREIGSSGSDRRRDGAPASDRGRTNRVRPRALHRSRADADHDGGADAGSPRRHRAGS